MPLDPTRYVYWPYKAILSCNYTQPPNIVKESIAKEIESCEDGIPLFGILTKAYLKDWDKRYDELLKMHRFYNSIMVILHELVQVGVPVLFGARLPRDTVGIDVTIYRVKAMPLQDVLAPQGKGIRTNIRIAHTHYYLKLQSSYPHAVGSGILTFYTSREHSPIVDTQENDVWIKSDIVVSDAAPEIQPMKEIALLGGI